MNLGIQELGDWNAEGRKCFAMAKGVTHGAERAKFEIQFIP